ncbi:threonine/serine dehydratase [Mycobacterium sp. 21AC1]|nr:threonine/serine dehydratase [Mycobacterium sp. 21AC1]
MPDLQSILKARSRIEGYIRRTPLQRAEVISETTGVDTYLKLETLQPTGSFKIRGASNSVCTLVENGQHNGIATASTGNHARAVAHMGNRMGLPVKVFVAASVPADRVAALHQLGATVDNSFADQSEAICAARNHAEANNFGFIPPFDHPDVISGQGTAALELWEDLDDIDAVVVPVSGGGLITGVGVAMKELRLATTVIGVCAENAPAMALSLRAGHPVSPPEIDTVATSLMGDLGPDNAYTFPLAQKCVDEIATVSESDITSAQRRLRQDAGIAAEAAAAAALAYLCTHRDRWQGRKVALLVTGAGDAQSTGDTHGQEESR